jgi:hypothetical protein
MHQPPHFIRSRCDLIDTGDNVHGLGRGKMMADGANAAEALDDDWNLPIHASLNKPFEPAELDDVEPGLLDLSRFIQPDRHLSMTFDARHRIDNDLSRALANLNVTHCIAFAKDRLFVFE